MSGLRPGFLQHPSFIFALIVMASIAAIVLTTTMPEVIGPILTPPQN